MAKNNKIIWAILIIFGILLVTQTNILGNQSVAATPAAQSNDDCTFRTNVVPGGFYSASEAVINVNVGSTLKSFVKPTASVSSSWAYDNVKRYTSTIVVSADNPDSIRMLYLSNKLYVYTTTGSSTLIYTESKTASDILSCSDNSTTSTTQPVTSTTQPVTSTTQSGTGGTGGGSTVIYYQFSNNACTSVLTPTQYLTMADCQKNIIQLPPLKTCNFYESQNSDGSCGLNYMLLIIVALVLLGVFLAWKAGYLKQLRF